MNQNFLNGSVCIFCHLFLVFNPNFTKNCGSGKDLYHILVAN